MADKDQEREPSTVVETTATMHGAMTESEIANLKAFAREILKAAWDCSIDGGFIQDLAESHCLIRPEIYDEAKHGEHEDAVPGEDTIYVFSDWMKG